MSQWLNHRQPELLFCRTRRLGNARRGIRVLGAPIRAAVPALFDPPLLQEYGVHEANPCLAPARHRTRWRPWPALLARASPTSAPRTRRGAHATLSQLRIRRERRLLAAQAQRRRPGLRTPEESWPAFAPLPLDLEMETSSRPIFGEMTSARRKCAVRISLIRVEIATASAF